LASIAAKICPIVGTRAAVFLGTYRAKDADWAATPFGRTVRT
jgi:hypothetical protein